MEAPKSPQPSTRAIQHLASPKVQVKINDEPELDGEERSQKAPSGVGSKADAHDAKAGSSGLVSGDSSTSPSQNQGPPSPLPAEGPPSSSVNRPRLPHAYRDSEGNEKTFHSTLSLLTRKFMDLLQVSAFSIVLFLKKKLKLAQTISSPFTLYTGLRVW
jgi:hypothetical protein